jgi:hypothetical protein
LVSSSCKRVLSHRETQPMLEFFNNLWGPGTK